VVQKYRCDRCNHLLFKSNLQLLLAKRHDPNATFIEPKSTKCGLINHFSYHPGSEFTK
jgi:phage FluMu protein Com